MQRDNRHGLLSRTHKRWPLSQPLRITPLPRKSRTVPILIFVDTGASPPPTQKSRSGTREIAVPVRTSE